MSKIIFLGTNTFPLYRESVNILIDISADAKILLEACGSLPRQLTRAGYAGEHIGNIFLSHIHGDHTIGYPLFLHCHWTARIAGKKGVDIVNICATEEVYQEVQRIAKTIFPKQMSDLANMVQLNLIDVTSETHTQQGQFTMTFLPVEHSVPTHACRIDLPGISKCVVYSADTRPLEKMVQFAHGADVLIHDAFCDHSMERMAAQTGHTTAKQAGLIAKEASVKKLVLIHMVQMYQGRENVLIEEASKEFDGEVILPNDLDILEL